MKESVVITGPNGARARATIIPDGYFRLNTGQYEYFGFLEADMGTETIRSSKFGRRDFSRKILAYKEYYRSGLYQRKYDPQERYEEFPMLVLTVTTSTERLANLKALAEACRGGGAILVHYFRQS